MTSIATNTYIPLLVQLAHGTILSHFICETLVWAGEIMRLRVNLEAWSKRESAAINIYLTSGTYRWHSSQLCRFRPECLLASIRQCLRLGSLSSRVSDMQRHDWYNVTKSTMTQSENGISNALVRQISFLGSMVSPVRASLQIGPSHACLHSLIGSVDYSWLCFDLFTSRFGIRFVRWPSHNGVNFLSQNSKINLVGRALLGFWLCRVFCEVLFIIINKDKYITET